jgi:hypothetical protein
VNGVNQGHLVVRIPLTDIQNGGTIHIGYTDKPLPQPTSWASQVTRNAAGTAYLAGHNSDRQMRVYSFPENKNGYTVHDVDIDPWPQGALSSLAPGGVDWLGFGYPTNQVLGAARLPIRRCGKGKATIGDQLVFAWTAAAGDGFPQPHVQVVTIDTQSYQKVSQQQIWSDSLAFGYPALSVNDRNELGIALGLGGANKTVDATFGVGFVGDSTIYIATTPSTASIKRYGDYFGIQPSSPNGGLFSAFGIYYTRNNTSIAGCGTSTSPNCSTNLSYIQFGRTSALSNQPPPKKCPDDGYCKCQYAEDQCVAACNAAMDECKKPKPGNPLPKDCVPENKACKAECYAKQGECLTKCQG